MSSKSLFNSLIAGLLLILVSLPAKAQYKDYSLKYGLHFDGLLPANEFNNWEYGVKTSYLGRAFIRLEFNDFLEGDLGAGYGENAGLDYNHKYYKSIMFPIDFRLHLSPFNLADWNPYLFAGIGAMYYDNKLLPAVASPKSIKKFGWTGIIPVGIGAEFNLVQGVLLDISGGVGYSLTDNLNFYKLGEPYDAHFNLGFGFTFVGNAGNSDNDYDGLTKTQEKKIGTDPENPDTDSDGIKDGDGVNVHNTNPLKADTDRDGLRDGEEVNKYRTDPLKTDTDGDALIDGEEVNKSNTDPLKADTDGDGLYDGDEVNRFTTDPNKEDTDGDGLSDGTEANKYFTNPLKADSDGDTITDGVEMTKYHTDPLKLDTDGGSVNDGKEVARGTDALNPEDDVVKLEAPIVLEGVNFAVNSAVLTSESEQTLQNALTTLKTNPDIHVEIRGYTDNTGSRSYNKKLSQKRAESVKNWLVNHGADQDKIVAVGMGPDNPIAPNYTPEGKMKNRRIEFVRVK
ncbi:MAG: OmpA family protein [Bacteroidetes bacterium]|nr:OmpA family protein [Bacteroidota bacterium]